MGRDTIINSGDDFLTTLFRWRWRRRARVRESHGLDPFSRHSSIDHGLTGMVSAAHERFVVGKEFQRFAEGEVVRMVGDFCTNVSE